jgi:hypothetical protein
MFRDLNGQLDKLQIIIAMLTLVAAAFFLIIGYWIWFDDPAPAVIHEITIQTPVVETGHLFRYTVDACKNTHHHATIKRTFIDGLIWATPPVNGGHILPGCGSISLAMEIPNGLPPGDYLLEVILEYEVNPVATREVVYTVGPFTVIEGES